MAISEELREAIDDYDRNTARPKLGSLVKGLRARGVRVTEIRETFDAAGIPARLELRAGADVVWEFVRLDVALDAQAAAPEPVAAATAAEKPGPPPSLPPGDDDVGGAPKWF